MEAINSASKRRRGQRGSIFLESLMGVFTLGVGAAAFFALLPTMHRAKISGNSHSQAVQMGNRMIEQLQLLKPKDLNATTLSQLNLIDAGQTASPFSFSKVPLDEASCYSPSQVLRDGTGSMTLTPLPSGSVRVELRISWKGESGKTSTVDSGTILGAYR